MGSKKSAPPMLPMYVPPAPYVAAPDPQQTVPKVLNASEVMQQGLEAEKLLPQWLQLNNDPMNPADRAQYESNYYQQYVNPLIEQAKADIYSNGQSYGSYGGALIGQMGAQGQLDKYSAGLNYAQQLYNNALSGRQSLFSGGPGVAQTQNQIDVKRGYDLAGIQNKNAEIQNNYNLGSAQMLNNYGLGNYQNAFNLYKYQQDQNKQRSQNLLGGPQTLLSGAFGLIGGSKSPTLLGAP